MMTSANAAHFVARLTLTTILLSVALPAWADLSMPGRVLTEGMSSFVAGLDDAQRDEALYDFDDDERFDLRLAPLGLEGLRLDQMTDDQWRELESLLAGVLSPQGMQKLNTIRSLEQEVKETERGFFGFLMGRMRDAKRYYLAVFGEPNADEPWGFRFDGHHLSLNVTATPEHELSATPLFFGGQPRAVPEPLSRAGLRVLANEEDRAVEFLNALTNEERAKAFVAWEEGSSIRRPMSISDDVDLVLPPHAGLTHAELDADKRAKFDALIEVHLRNFSPPIAHRLRRDLYAGKEPISLVYASAGDTPEAVVEAGRALYYRIQGGGLSIEFDDTAAAADHIHVVFRHPVRDFGRDLLLEHHTNHHASSND